MAELNSKHVTWEGLQYYDSKIKDYVDSAIKQLEDSSTTDEEVAQIREALNRVNELAISNQAKIDELFNQNTENEVNIDKLFDFDKTNSENIKELQTRVEYLATKEELEAARGDLKVILDDIKEIENKLETDHITLEELRLAMENVATEDELKVLTEDVAAFEQKLEDAVDTFATKEYVTQKIAEAELADKDVDLTAYYTKTETDAKIKEAVDSIEHPDMSHLATKEELATVQEQSARNEVKILAHDSELFDIKEDIKSIQNAGYITETVLDNYYNKSETDTAIEKAIESIDIPEVDLEPYATKIFVEEQVANLATKEELEGLASEDWVKSELAKIDPTIPSEYITESELEEKGYATEQFVNDKIADISIPEAELYKVDYNKPNYAAAREAYKNGKVLVLINAAPDVNSYAIMNYVSDKYITFTKFLMSRSSAYGAFNTYYLKPDNTWELAKEVILNKVEANVSDATDKELTSIRIGKEVYRLPKIDLSNYYTKAEVNDIIPAVPTKVSELENDAGYLTEHQDLSEYAKKTDIPSHEDFVTKDALEEVAQDVVALNKSTVKQRYEILTVPGLGVTYRDDEIRLNTEHIELKQQDVGEGGESNAYYIGIRIYAPENAHGIRQNVRSAPGIQEGKEIVPFTDSDVDAYGRKYSNAWVKCAIYQNGKWTNYGLSSTIDKCLGYYYSVEWFDATGNIIENDTIHVIFTNDSCHYSNISDAVSRRFVDVKSSINNIEQNYVTNQYIQQNYTTTEQIAATYVTEEKVTEVVTNEVNTVVTDQIETKVTEVIEKKVEAGEITVTADKISYGDFEDDII